MTEQTWQPNGTIPLPPSDGLDTPNYSETTDAETVPDTRIWIETAEDADDTTVDLAGWYSVVDAKAGGIVAYAESLEKAQIIRAALLNFAY